MQPSPIKRYIPLMTILGVLVVLVASFAIYQNSRFHVVSINPSTGNFPAVSPFFQIRLNKTINPKTLRVTSSTTIISSYGSSGKNINISLNEPLVIGTQYDITIESVSDTSGAVIRNKSFSFTPKDIASNQLPKDVQQALLQKQTSYSKTAYSDPILKYLPHDTLTYNLTPSTNVVGGKTVLTINAELLLSDADVNTDEAGAISQYKQQVLDYITSVGLDPGKYNIVFTTNQ